MSILLGILLAFVPSAHAYDAEVQFVGDTPIENVISEAKSHASADLKGPGKALKLTYTSNDPLTVLILFPEINGGFTPLESLQVDLRAGAPETALIDLTVSPGWTPWRKAYTVHFLTSSSKGAQFHDVEFVEAHFAESILLSLKQVFRKAPYTPSSYHRIPAFIIGGMSLTTLVGVVMILCSLTLVYKRRFGGVITLVVFVTLAVHVRFSVDAVRYSVDHTSGNFSAAGSLFEVADTIKELDVESVELCHDGTSFAKRLLAYHIYPIPITKEASHVVVHKSLRARFDGSTLRCGGRKYSAREIKTFDDGSTLYSIES